MSSRLSLYLLGPPQLFLDNAPLTTTRRKAMALLAYLTIEQGQHRREGLSALLWPDYDQSKAFTNLRHTLWEIQHSIGEGWLVTDHERIGVSENADIWLDVHQFDTLLAQSHIQNDISLRMQLLQESIKLYRDHFLTGFSVKDAPSFNEWAFAEAEERRCQLAGILIDLSDDHCAIGQAAQAIPYARRLLTLDPFNESAHRRLMKVYWQAGQHSAALKQYQACEKILRKELGLDPQPETYALYQQMRKGEKNFSLVAKPAKEISPRNNLPHQLSSFIGREKEQKEIAEMVAENRLVTLTGAGGIGKTRLSIQVASALVNNFPDGTCFVEFAPVPDPRLVSQVIVTALGLLEEAGRSPVSLLTDFLRPKRILLILDNCEHLIQACAEVAEMLLRACPNLHILSTSREALNVGGEMVYLLPTLTIPDPTRLMLEILSQYEAVQLFLDRARMTMPDFSMTHNNAFAIMQICHQLNGIPLALELAAARIKVLSVQQIADRLEHAVGLLVEGKRTAPPRHQTLRAAIDWSYDLLSKKEQVLFQRLSVFAGGFKIEAIEAICVTNDIEADEILELLTCLVDKSLLLKEEQGSQARYHFLEPIRQYAYERLSASGQASEIRDRHLEFYLSLAEEAELKLVGAEEIEWLNKLEVENHNLRAALEWSVETDVEAGLRLAGALYWFWAVRAFWEEGRTWLGRLLGTPQALSLSLLRAKALNVAGYLAWYQSDATQAGSLHLESLGMYRELGHQIGIARALCGLGWVARSQHNYDAARKFYEESLAIRREVNDQQGIAESLLSMGALAYYQGELTSARSLLEESLSIWRELENRSGTAPTLSYLARVADAQGNYEYATILCEESLALFRKLGDNYGCIYTLHYLGHMAYTQAVYNNARALYLESLKRSRQVGHNRFAAISLYNLGHVALAENNYSEARTRYAESLKILSRSEQKQDLTNCLVGWAKLIWTLGHPEQATIICGFVELLLQGIQQSLVSLERAMYRQVVADLRAQLDEETFVRAWEKGRAMTLDEVVTYAIADTESRM